MKYNKMKKSKAIKHLGYSRDDLVFWREAYVITRRNTNSLMDIKSSYLAEIEGYETLREFKVAECIQNINEAKERIARFERMVR